MLPTLHVATLSLDCPEVVMGERGLGSIVLILVTAAVVAGVPVSPAVEPAERFARVGFVAPGSPSSIPQGSKALWERLRELGWVEGQNFVVEARWGEGRAERLPALIAELIGSKIDVLVTYGTQAALTAKNATSTVPIVATAMGEPLRTGLATNLAHPGGNLTGLSLAWGEGVGGKWLELLQETVPRLTTLAVIAVPDNPAEREVVKDLQSAAVRRGLKLRIIGVQEAGDLDLAFAEAGHNAQAVMVLPIPSITAPRRQITALAAKHRLPAMYALRDDIDAGGLMAYAPNYPILFRRAADYVDKILKGAKPADLPIEQMTQFELVVNLKTAKALGITIPESILIRADEVIR
jgi:putative tryptophan/tyrosine transport system substrate-binding protein